MVLIHTNTSNDPALNLAMEEYCFRRMSRERDYVLFYINKPSVIVGRHQAIHNEVDLDFARQKQILVLRRISGGGAVYHDLGNLNVSFITAFDREKLQKFKQLTWPLLKTLRDWNVAAHQTVKNDLFVGECKISGAAQYTDMRRLLSHATMLFNSDLKILNRVLDTRSSDFSKYVRSIKSPVANILPMLAEPISIDDFKAAMLNSLKAYFPDEGEQWLTDAEWQHIHELADRNYRSGTYA